MKRDFSKLFFESYFTSGKKAEVLFKWQKTDSVIKNNVGDTIFSAKNIEFPKHWNQLSIDITVSKYFRKINGKHERSLKQLVSRVADVLKDQAIKQKYLNQSHAQIFHNELKYILYSQRAAFNSPVWFNLGVFQQPQTSACFIQKVDDSIESIYDLLKNEGLVFKYGSGSGSNFSKLRSRFENLETGGTSSGLMSFLNVFDAAAGAIKSGGITRRAAKMVIVDVDHPEIEDFISFKAREEDLAHALDKLGFSSGINGELIGHLHGQNANNSVRVSDKFMKAVKNDTLWSLRTRTSRKVLKKISARKLWDQIADAAYKCADPGLQFHDTINAWHTCPRSGPINASNPCSEYMFLDDTSCNLASLNLIHFVNEQGNFDFEAFKHTVSIIFLAQELLIDFSKYPTLEIEKNSNNFRTLGIGFTNLGGVLLKLGIPYDSEKGRAFASFLSAQLTGEAYLSSTEFARIKKPFYFYSKNKNNVFNILKKHKQATTAIEWKYLPKDFKNKNKILWESVLSKAKQYGVRNAQVSVIAPTGTISFFMGSDTTGIEPEFSFYKTKSIVSEKNQSVEIVIENNLLVQSLKNLSYMESEINDIRVSLLKNKNFPYEKLKSDEHRKIFETALGPFSVSADAHLLMMAAVQPFVSGAISKTINLPNQVSKEEIKHIHFRAWELGLKSVSIYRDLSKISQPLNTTSELKNNGTPKCFECGHETELRGGCFVCTHCGLSIACG